FLKEHVDEATKVITLQDAEIRVRELHMFWKSEKHLVMGIWFKETNTYIGNIWIQPDKWENPSFNLGYFLDKGYTGKGLATEAAKRAVKFIFEDLQATKVRLFTRDTNERSYKLAERLGFVKEGHDRENIRHEGKMIGLLHYGLLKREYLENPIYKD
ncbi:MAG: GNAT family N-acetyltransferase, partial [Candidatus Heimdallarchaeota archaeon]